MRCPRLPAGSRVVDPGADIGCDSGHPNDHEGFVTKRDPGRSPSLCDQGILPLVGNSHCAAPRPNTAFGTISPRVMAMMIRNAVTPFVVMRTSRPSGAPCPVEINS